jgi:hypothetical protein
MRGRFVRALCVAGLFAFPASGALAGTVVQSDAVKPLDLTSYSTIVDQNAAPRARLAGQFDLGNPVDLPELSFGPPGYTAALGYDSVAHLNLLSGVSLDFGTASDLAGRFNSYDAGGSSAYDGLFFSASAVNSPYASLASGGTFASANLDLTPRVHLMIGGASLVPGLYDTPMSAAATVARMGGAPPSYDLRSANSILAGVSFDIAPWAAIGLIASQTAEHNSLLGDYSPVAQSADTSALDVSARVQLGGGWMTTASFAQAVTKLDLKPGFGATPDDLHTRSYGLAVAKRGLFGNDAMGLAVSWPATGNIGGSDFALVSGVGTQQQFIATDRALDSHTPETDLEFGYVTTFMDGSVALQTNAAYQMNFAGQTGTNAISLLSRAKIKF